MSRFIDGVVVAAMAPLVWCSSAVAVFAMAGWRVAGCDAGEIPCRSICGGAVASHNSTLPAEGEPGSWQAMQEIARDMDCVIKLGGRREKKRKARHVARLTVKGANAED